MLLRLRRSYVPLLFMFLILLTVGCGKASDPSDPPQKETQLQKTTKYALTRPTGDNATVNVISTSNNSVIANFDMVSEGKLISGCRKYMTSIRTVCWSDIVVKDGIIQSFTVKINNVTPVLHLNYPGDAGEGQLPDDGDYNAGNLVDDPDSDVEDPGGDGEDPDSGEEDPDSGGEEPDNGEEDPPPPINTALGIWTGAQGSGTGITFTVTEDSIIGYGSFSPSGYECSIQHNFSFNNTLSDPNKFSIEQDSGAGNIHLTVTGEFYPDLNMWSGTWEISFSDNTTIDGEECQGIDSGEWSANRSSAPPTEAYVIPTLPFDAGLDISQWSNVPPVIIDPQGDCVSQAPVQQRGDILKLFLGQDGANYYVVVQTASYTIAPKNIRCTLELRRSSATNPTNGDFGVQLSVTNYTSAQTYLMVYSHPTFHIYGDLTLDPYSPMDCLLMTIPKDEIQNHILTGEYWVKVTTEIPDQYGMYRFVDTTNTSAKIVF